MIWQRLCIVAGIQTIHSQPSFFFFPHEKDIFFPLHKEQTPEWFGKCCLQMPLSSRQQRFNALGCWGHLSSPLCCWWSSDCSFGDRAAQTNLWTCALLTTHNLPSRLLSVPVQWIWSQANPFGDDNIWGGSIFSRRFFTFQVFFLHEHRREGEEGASSGQLIGHCCQSNVGVTAAEVLTSSDLWRHPSIQPRAREGSQSWL